MTVFTRKTTTNLVTTINLAENVGKKICIPKSLPRQKSSCTIFMDKFCKIDRINKDLQRLKQRLTEGKIFKINYFLST